MNFAFLALGVFFGNWLVVPVFSERTFTDGFWIGLIAAVLVMAFGGACVLLTGSPT